METPDGESKPTRGLTRKRIMQIFITFCIITCLSILGPIVYRRGIVFRKVLKMRIRQYILDVVSDQKVYIGNCWGEDIWCAVRHMYYKIETLRDIINTRRN